MWTCIYVWMQIYHFQTVRIAGRVERTQSHHSVLSTSPSECLYIYAPQPAHSALVIVVKDKLRGIIIPPNESSVIINSSSYKLRLVRITQVSVIRLFLGEFGEQVVCWGEVFFFIQRQQIIKPSFCASPNSFCTTATSKPRVGHYRHGAEQVITVSSLRETIHVGHLICPSTCINAS